MNPITYIQKYNVPVDQAVKSIFENEIQNNTSVSSREALSKLQRFVTRGKHVRSGLFLIALEMLKTTPGDTHFSIAAGLEIMHSSFLIHDDIMDNDDMRRGEPSIHASYRIFAEQQNFSTPRDYGIALGLGAGDIAMFLAHKTILNATKGMLCHEKLLLYGINEYLRVGYAQMQDVQNSYTKTEPTPDEIKYLYIQKTARYTFSLPFVYAALISEQSPSVIEQFQKLGEHIGLLYQLRDDEIGIFNASEITGKPVGSDIRENKKTLMHALLVSSYNDSENTYIQSLKHKKTLTNNDIVTIQKLMKKYEIFARIDKIKNESKQKSLKTLHLLPTSEKYSFFIRDLIDYIEKRDK